MVWQTLGAALEKVYAFGDFRKVICITYLLAVFASKESILTYATPFFSRRQGVAFVGPLSSARSFMHINNADAMPLRSLWYKLLLLHFADGETEAQRVEPLAQE